MKPNIKYGPFTILLGQHITDVIAGPDSYSVCKHGKTWKNGQSLEPDGPACRECVEAEREEGKHKA